MIKITGDNLTHQFSGNVDGIIDWDCECDPLGTDAYSNVNSNHVAVNVQ